MSFSINFSGGALFIMMGQHTRSESLFYYFRMEDHIPEDHLLRLVDRHVDFAFVRESLKASYSHTGRPSIDPEVLLRILLIGYLYGITSERRLVEDVGMHLAYRWFTGLGFDQEVPHHSTFSKNRHGRFEESPLFLDLFERIVQQCMDGSSEFAYYDNYLIDNRSCIIAGVMATPARLSQEIVAARQMLERAKERFGLQPVSITADKSYGTGEFLSWLSNRQMTPYIPVLDRKQQTKGFYTQHDFTRVPEENAYRCPAGHLLHYIGLSRGSQGFTYSAKPSQCRNCSHKPACTPSATRRTLRVNWYEDVREHARKLSQTPEYAIARRARNKIEALFSELRNQIRLRKLRLRGLPRAGEQFILAATVQNIKRLVRFMSKSKEPEAAMA